MTTVANNLQLAVHDQLKKDYEYWQLVLLEFTWIADEYQTKGRTDFLIDWDAIKGRFYSFRQTVYSAANDGIAEEIEGIVITVDSENRGVFYLNKWADLNNRFSAYINQYCENHTDSLSKLLGSGLTDDETICSIQTAAKDAGLGLVRISEKVVSELSRLVWYKQHTDLITIKTVPTSTDQTPEPKGADVKDLDLNVKILLANQCGILNGTFHTLPVGKQYGVLAALFGKSEGNVKNALTALWGDANTNKNPQNLPSVVEKTNNLITENDLGVALAVGRQKR